MRPGDDGLPLSTIRAYAGPSITGLVVFEEVGGELRVTSSFNVDDFNVKPPQDGWGAHDVYYPFFPLPPPTASRRRTLGRRTSMERRERSRGRSAAKRERNRSRGRSRERLGGAGRRSPARKEAEAGAGVGEVGCLPFKGPAEAIASCGQEELPVSQEEEVPNPLPPEGSRGQREGALPSLPSFFHFPLYPRHRRQR